MGLIRVTANEVSSFKHSWPASGLPNDYDFYFEFASNGDLVDLWAQPEGTKFAPIGRNHRDTERWDGPALVALSQDAQGGKRGAKVANPRSRPNLIHHSIGYPTKAEAERAKRKLGHGKVRKAGGWWYVVGPKGNPGIPREDWIRPRRVRAHQTLHYFMLSIYDSESERLKVSPQTLTRLLPSVAAAKDWAQEEVDEYGGVGYLYKDTKQIAKIRAARANPGPSSIPTRWTKATVYRAGKKIMARIGGRQ